ncbi:gamma-aminobutyric acid type B receptor subunit 1-like [Mercenaria mercenaria]|uniref:gamma-aminobutyric acid type B receptor subunit 1-like n=1 Tax=Mercenaria mercenaria TaxID=6596 RepID=UPI001E1DE8CE|nr:gamma-aminobutyric acid type B receptor subunit 1-like [Mercenaria mercenaria]
MLSETGVSYKSGGSCLTATQMALEDVNTHSNILKDYNLTYRWLDSKAMKHLQFNDLLLDRLCVQFCGQTVLTVLWADCMDSSDTLNSACDPGTALYRMFERLNNDPPYLLLLGGACSVVTEATAQVSYMWNITQLSYESSSPVLSDRARFPRFFRLYPPDQKLNIARIALMKQFNWKRVATINEAKEYFSAVIDDFVQRAKVTDVTIISQEIFVNEPFARIQNLKQHDARIIITAMYEDKARKVLCAAFKIGLYGPHIVWMFVGWYSKTFWKVDLDEVDCTEEQMTLTVEGAFITGAVFMNPVEEKGIAGITATEFEMTYFNHPTYNPEWASTDAVAPLCYDHIWVAALALECALQSIQRIDGQREKIGLYRLDLENKFFEWTEGSIRWRG